MLVKITNCKYSSYWYAGLVGRVFEVTESNSYPLDYRTLDNPEAYARYLSKSDCEVVEVENIADAKTRKCTPIFSGVLNYFPDALRAVAQASHAGQQQHNPDKPLAWDRSKSGDELDALTRHLLEAGTVDTDGILHSTKVAWRALANLQKEIEKSKDVSNCT
jgi:hypothetical protein